MQRRISLFWPLALIAAGTLWILIQLGRISVANLWALTYLWPFLLIAAGIGLIIRPYWNWAEALMSVLVIGGLFVGVLFAPRWGLNHIPENAISGVFPVGSAERGSGHVITQSRPVGDFQSIHLAYPAKYNIRQGSTESLTIEAEDNVAAAVRTRAVGGVLEVDNGREHNRYIAPTRPTTIDITVKDLKEVRFDSAGEVNVQGLHTSDFKALLDGAGTLNLEDIDLASLDAVLSGVGSVRASGTADLVNVRVDGLGSFEGAGLHSKTTSVSLDGLGSATVWADNQLTAILNGLGSVEYYGSAGLTKTVNGLGSVRYMGMK